MDTAWLKLNIYDIFPKEIWLLILSDLQCKYIRNFQDINDISKDLCIKENIIEKQKMMGFPRESGHCKNYDIIHSHLKLLRKAIINKEGVENVLDKILNQLYERNYELIRGDLINFDKLYSEIFIFDGCDIIIGTKIYGGGHYFIPEEFTVVNNNIPIEYWDYNKKTENNITIKSGLRFNRHIWFNHSSVKQQCIDNICYDDIQYVSYTWFIYNDTYYVIALNNQSYDHKLKQFKNVLSNEKVLLLDRINNGYRIGINDKVIDNKNILFINYIDRY